MSSRAPRRSRLPVVRKGLLDCAHLGWSAVDYLRVPGAPVVLGDKVRGRDVRGLGVKRCRLDVVDVARRCPSDLDALLDRYGLSPRKTYNRPEYGPTPTRTLCMHGADVLLKLQVAETPAAARRLVRAAELNVRALLVPNRVGEWR